MLLIELFTVLMFTKKEWVEEQIQHEYAKTREIMGAESAQRVYADADRWFKDLVVSTGVFQKSYEMFIPAGKRDMDGVNTIGKGITWFEERLNGFWAVVFLSFQRIALFNTWLAYALLLLVPAAIDGWAQRAIKRETFGHTSPTRYAMAILLILGLLITPLAYFFIPIAITPLFPPLWVVVATAAIMLLASNTQKQI